ncbi:MAG: 3',5'-cyclic-nucleotide phosphodiesterase [Nitrospiraceae bacterium]|nr:3',5'-cyclic-nucleotide phosphodiesterase [Nitrospiraceae bacterium]
MILKVLGSAGAEFPGYNPPAFLLDKRIMLDAGTIGAKLSAAEQLSVRNILITHSHLDHIKGIPFLADNVIIANGRQSIMLYGIKETLQSLRKNLLNNRIWPDFTKISTSIAPVIRLRQVTPGRTFRIEEYAIRAFPVDHTVPAVGYLVRDAKGKSLLYTGDTGPTFRIWEKAGSVDALVIEVSFPNAMEDLAIKTGHLTPAMLVGEIGKMKETPRKIFITHPKPQFIKQIRKELARIRMQQIEMLQDGRSYRI